MDDYKRFFYMHRFLINTITSILPTATSITITTTTTSITILPTPTCTPMSRQDLVGSKDIGDLTERRALVDQLQCKSFKWFLDTVSSTFWWSPFPSRWPGVPSQVYHGRAVGGLGPPQGH